ncbi:MAG TPA: FAD:protein FMN transferase [Ktedonobacterales bacterium]|jgi:thiamine biosynthesis lipoprotein
MTRLVSHHLRGMNTDFHLTVRVEDPSVADAERALDVSAAWLGEIERTCSRFLPEGELCALNASSGHTFVASDNLYAAVACAIEMAKHTDGLFDPTILPALLAAGYTRSFDEIGQREIGGSDSGAQAPSDWRSGRWREIQLDSAAHTIALPVGVTLDLGGVAKGWAADEVARRFLGSFPAYLINLGGDLRVRGEPEPGKGWLIGIEDPQAAPSPGKSATEPQYLAAVELRHGGIATSGPARRWWLRDGQRMNHLIDPRSGQPVESSREQRAMLSCTVLAATAVEADVYAKVAFLRGYPAGLESLPNGMAGLCVFADGTFAASAGLEAYLRAQSSSEGHAHA